MQIQERSPDGRMSDYNYAMSQIGHELGHRWAADARALVNDETITLGPVHWATGVHLPAGDMENMMNFYKNLVMAGGFLYVIAFGAGAIAFDHQARTA